MRRWEKSPLAVFLPLSCPQKESEEQQRSVNISEWQSNPLAEKEDLNWDLFLRVSICKMPLHACIHAHANVLCACAPVCMCRHKPGVTICCLLIHPHHLISIWIDSCNADSFHPCYSWKQPITASTEHSTAAHWWPLCIHVSFTHCRQCYHSPCIFNSSLPEL